MNDCREAKGWRDEWRFLTIGTLALAVLLTARFLEPSPAGVGTHQQLGLPPCPFLTMTTIPCPLCGLTTSISLAARGTVFAALLVQPFGLVIFLGSLVTTGIATTSIWWRIDLIKRVLSRRANQLFYTLTIIFILSWLYKIASMKLNLFNQVGSR